MRTINPATEESQVISEASSEELQIALMSARKETGTLRKMPVSSRVALMKQLPEILLSEVDSLARIIAEEMGKPLSQGKGEVERTAAEAKFVIDRAEEWLQPEPVNGPSGVEGQIQFDPLGVAAVISPWNFPIMLPLRAIVPAFLSGNTVVFKPSEITPRSGEALRQIFGKSIVDGVSLTTFISVVIGGKSLGKELVQGDVNVIAFTGSSQTGKQIAKAAAERMKRVVLELGGLDAAIVLQDADIEKTATGILQGNLNNSGQVCAAIKRVFVERPIATALTKELLRQASEISVSDPLEDRGIGPLASAEQLARVESFVADAIERGAKIEIGGERVARKGFFFPPTILTGITRDMKLMEEEPFGPVLPIIPVDSAEEAAERANDTKYGLTASVWTANQEKAKEVASLLDVGIVSHNEHKAGGAGCPFGGTKESGGGRLKTKEGLREFCNPKFLRF